jgi:hypothetical protein
MIPISPASLAVSTSNPHNVENHRIPQRRGRAGANYSEATVSEHLKFVWDLPDEICAGGVSTVVVSTLLGAIVLGLLHISSSFSFPLPIFPPFLGSPQGESVLQHWKVDMRESSVEFSFRV